MMYYNRVNTLVCTEVLRLNTAFFTARRPRVEQCTRVVCITGNYRPLMAETTLVCFFHIRKDIDNLRLDKDTLWVNMKSVAIILFILVAMIYARQKTIYPDT